MYIYLLRIVALAVVVAGAAAIAVVVSFSNILPPKPEPPTISRARASPL